MYFFRRGKFERQQQKHVWYLIHSEIEVSLIDFSGKLSLVTN
jgi:hypothetical protein